MASPETISFYWINAETPRVHSVPLTVSGPSVIDMSDYADFWQQTVTEMGYLVQPAHFDTTGVRSLTLSPTLFDASEALFTHWLTPAPLSHRLINTTTGHVDAPVMLQRWLTSAFFCICLLGLGWAAYSPPTRETQLAAVAAAVGSALAFGHGDALEPSARHHETITGGRAGDDRRVAAPAPRIATLAAQLKQFPMVTDQPILAVGTDATGELHAARLPFMTLPRRAIAMSEGQLITVAGGWQGNVVVLGDEEGSRNQLVRRLQQVGPFKPVDAGTGFVVLRAGGSVSRTNKAQDEVVVLHIGKYFPPDPGGMETYLRDLMVCSLNRGCVQRRSFIARSTLGARLTNAIHQGSMCSP